MSQSTDQRPSGFKCPVCYGFIPVSIYQLIQAGTLSCPHCNLEISINPEQSQKAINALKKIKEAEDHVQSTSSFNR